MDLKDYIIDVVDFPKPGIIFKDISPLLSGPRALEATCKMLAKTFDPNDYDLIVGPESRGFIFGVGLALTESKGFIPVRKPGKLPRETVSVSYDLEYGTDSLEIHRDAVKPGQRVLIVDDLLATGGTIEAVIKLLEKLECQVVGCSFVVELENLNGRDKISHTRVESLVKY